MSKTLAELDAQERGRKLGDPQQVVDGLLQGRRPGLGGPVDPDAALAAVLARDRKHKAGPAAPTRLRGIGPGPGWADGGNKGGFLDLVGDALGFLGD